MPFTRESLDVAPQHLSMMDGIAAYMDRMAVENEYCGEFENNAARLDLAMHVPLGEPTKRAVLRAHYIQEFHSSSYQGTANRLVDEAYELRYSGDDRDTNIRKFLEQHDFVIAGEPKFYAADASMANRREQRRHLANR